MSDRVGLNALGKVRLGVAILMTAGLMVASFEASAESATGTAAGDNSEESVVIGVGLVIGLPGTGDSGIDEELVERSIVGVLRSAGLDPWRDQITPGRVAKVVVTAEMPTRGNSAEGLDVTVTAIGDATSLAGGTLLATPLRDAEGHLYAMGQGEIEMDGRVAAVADQPAGTSEVAMAEGTIVNNGRAQELAVD